jgi:hypothetical protein
MPHVQATVALQPACPGAIAPTAGRYIPLDIDKTIALRRIDIGPQTEHL